MFLTKFLKRIDAGDLSHKSIFIQKSIMLPFVPFPGMRYVDGGFESDVVSVTWDNEYQGFICDSTKDDRLYLVAKNGATTSLTVNDILKKYIATGWERCERDGAARSKAAV